MNRLHPILAALLIGASSCDGGADGTPAASPIAPQPARPTTPTPLPPPAQEPTAISFRTETGVDKAVEALGVSGEGVIVGIMDRGIDWKSNDFRNGDGSTRIAFIFDLSDDSGAGDPSNSYGRRHHLHQGADQ